MHFFSLCHEIFQPVILNISWIFPAYLAKYFLEFSSLPGKNFPVFTPYFFSFYGLNFNRYLQLIRKLGKCTDLCVCVYRDIPWSILNSARLALITISLGKDDFWTRIMMLKPFAPAKGRIFAKFQSKRLQDLLGAQICWDFKISLFV